MTNNSHPIHRAFMTNFNTRFTWVIAFVLLTNSTLFAQIFEPEGLNMPGAYNGFANPPTNVKFGNASQVAGGQLNVHPSLLGQRIWQTTFSAAASGGNIVGGNHDYLFTSGPTGTPYSNKWGGVTSTTLNTISDVFIGAGQPNNNCTFTNNRWYTMNWWDQGYVNTKFVIMETTGDPVAISGIQQFPGAANVSASSGVMVRFNLSASPSAEERFYVRYTINNFASSTLVQAVVNGTSAYANIPPFVAATNVKYYIFSSTLTAASIGTNYDLSTIKINNNGNSNFSYTVLGAFSQYERTAFTGTYAANSGGTPISVTGDDEISGNVALPFSFTYGGTAYTNFQVCTNGWIGLNTGTSLSQSAVNLNLFGTNAPNVCIAPWFDDTGMQIGGANYVISGTTPNRVLTIEFIDILSYYISSTVTLAYQVKLYETSNIIEFWYGSRTGALSGSNSGESASIGLEWGAGGLGNYIDGASGSRTIGNACLNASQFTTLYHLRFVPYSGTLSAIPAGTYTVGLGGNYANLSQAFAALNQRGINGAVTLSLTDANHTVAEGNYFPLALDAITGTSSGSQLILDGNNTSTISYSGGGATFTVAGSSTTTLQALSTSDTEPIVMLAGTDFTTIKNLNITQSASPYATPVYLDIGIKVSNLYDTNGATNNLIQNVTITLNRLNTNSKGILQNGTAPPVSSAGANSFNRYYNINVRNSYAGVNLNGIATFPDISCEIGTATCTTYNSIGDPNTPNDIGNGSIGSYGIRATFQSGVKIFNNVVRNVTSTGQTDGIFLELFQGTASVYNNKVQTIRNSSTSGTTGISGISASHASSGTNTARIYNNQISEILSSYTGSAVATRTIKGLHIRGTGGSASQTYEIYNNTVSINGSASPNISSSCFEIATTSGPVFTLRNNIFANFTAAQGATAKHSCIVSTSGTTFGPAGTTSNNNNFYIANDLGTSGHIGIGNATPYNTVAAWTGAMSPAGLETASQSVNPAFVNNITDLHSNSILLNGAGVAPPAYLTVDAECSPRTPDNDVGAFILNLCTTATGGNVTPAPQTLCEGSTATMNAFDATVALGITYQWEVSSTGGGVGFADVAGGIGATTTSYITGNLIVGVWYYRLRVTCSNGPVVGYSNELTVTVNANPIASISPALAPICGGGGSVELTASGGVSYLWSPVTGLSSTNTATVTASPTVNTTYTVTVTNASGCSATASRTVTIELAMTAGATATPTTVCSGGNTQLNATGGNTMAYTVTSTPYSFITPVSPTTVTFSSGDNDDGRATIAMPFTFEYFGIQYSTIYIHTNGFVTFSTGQPAGSPFNETIPNGTTPNNYIAICHDDLNVTGGGAVTYFTTGVTPNRRWVIQYTNVKFYNSADNNGVVSGQIQLFENDNHIEIHLTEITDPTLSAHAVGIENNTGSLGYAPTGRNNNSPLWSVPSASPEAWKFTPSGGTLAYLWSESPTLPATLSSTNIANPMGNGLTVNKTYTVTVTETVSGCTKTASVAVTLSAPTAGITNNTGTTILTCSTTSINVTATGGSSYAWSGGATPSTAANSFNTAGTYTVTVTGSGGCTATASITITADNTPPTAGITNNTGTTILTCITTSISVTATGGSSYAWSGGATPTTAANSFTAAGTYTVTVTDSGGCTATASIAVTADNTPPTAGITNNTGTTILTCITTSINVTATGGSSYAWSGGATPTTAANSFTAAGTYTVTVTGSGGCTATASITITLLYFTGLNSTYCATDASVTLTGSQAPNGTFSGPGITDNGNGTATFNPATAGTGGTVAYSITVENHWASVSTGFGHTIALKPDGTLWAWGRNDLGQLGIGNNTSQNSPVQIGIASNWASIATGIYHTIALKTDGTLWAWGFNNNGQLGIGNNTDQNSPVQIGIANNWSSIAAEGYHTIALKTDGTLWAWGRNDFGQLGIGNNTNQNSPVQIGIANNWSSIAAGISHTIALKTDGTLWVWGYNFYGQLGIGNNTNQNSPVQIGIANNWSSIAAGGYHSTALKSNGTLWAWGHNLYGQLGIGNNTDQNSPVQIGIANNWASASVGANHTIALKTDGTLWVWGYNFYGQLGIGNNTNQNSPVQIGIANNWASAFAGFEHTFALKTDGTLWAWGRNDFGQLGIGNNTNQNSPIKVNSFSVVSSSQTVAVASPTAGITNNSGTTILTCITTSISVTATGGSNYAWSGGATPTTAANTFTAAGAYTVTVTDSGGCTATASITITANNTPPTAGITNNSGTTILTCITTSISVTATGGSSYAWSGGATPSTATNSFTTAGTYTVTVTGSNGCTATASIAITEDITPPITPVISGATSFCEGDNTTLSIPEQSGATYCWTDNNSTGTWETVGSAGFSAGLANYQSLVINGSTPYVAYQDGGNGNRTTVMKFNGTAWETVGIAGFSADVAEYQSLAFNGSTPYVAYQDGGNGDRTTVMKFNGTAWETVGSAGFSAGIAGYQSLAFDGSIPYVAYQDAGNGNKTTVMKFNGTAWETVGSAGFSADVAIDQSLAFSGSTPYVTYRDGGNGFGTTVMKFNGTAWETVGSAGFSAGVADFQSLAFNGSDPYVAYRDHGNGFKTTAMKFNGTAWETVGSEGFSAGLASYQSLAFNDGTPYVAYYDAGNSDKTTVMKFNGTAWETVGSAGFSAGLASYQSLAFNGSTPYVAYQDEGNDYKTTVMKFVETCLSETNSLLVNAAGTYKVTVTINNGCTASASQAVTVNALPTPGITNNTGTTILTCTTTSISVTATGGSSYAWSGGATPTIAANSFTTAGTYTVTVTDSGGCTAMASISITTNNTSPTADITNNTGTTILTCITTSISVTATGGSSYAWSGGTTPTTAANSFTTAGTYTVTITSSGGCTATASITITEEASTSNTTTITACDSYTWPVNSTTYTASDTYTYVTGCHTEILILTIVSSTSNTTTITACDSYEWSENSTVYTASGTYTSVTGCHTEILILTIVASTSNTTTITACDNYTWSVNSTVYTASGTYTSVTGCHTEILILTIVGSSSNTTTITACDSFLWDVNGMTYTESDTYTYVTGCHTEILILTIVSSTSNTTTITACDSFLWDVNGTTYTASGSYTSVTGCHTEIFEFTIIGNVIYTTTKPLAIVIYGG